MAITINTDGQPTSTIPDLLESNKTLYPEYKCRAWVNFNGIGAVAIRGSGNVSSITDNNNTGDYTVNFINPMPDIHYCTTGATGIDPTSYASFFAPNRIGTTGGESTPTTASVRVNSVNHSNYTANDVKYIFVAIFR
jgi:hypothetical protein